MSFGDPTRARAAICREAGIAFTIEEVAIDPPRAGEVLVKIVGAGVCHTDMAVRDQQIPVPLPLVLGHEGSGIVETVGPGVAGIMPGDKVVLSFASCGACRNCAADLPSYCYNFGAYNFAGARLDGSTGISFAGGSDDGAPIHSHFFGQSSFGTYALVDARSLVPLPPQAGQVPLELLGPLGCGIQTGAGAVLNSLRVQEGDRLLIFGAGAVGLSAVMAGKIAGAGQIIAVDIHQERLDLAAELGASDTVLSGDDLESRLADICPDGVQYAFDTTGIAALIELGFSLLLPHGTIGLVGASAPDAMLSFNETSLMGGGKRVIGILEGDSDPQRFIPELIAYYQAGRFPFDRLVEYFPFTQIEEAFAAGESGRVIKPVVTMS